MFGEDYSVTVKNALVEGLRYYCPKCVERYDVRGLLDMVYEKYHREREPSHKDDGWYYDD